MVLPDAKPSGAISDCFLYLQNYISIALSADFCVISAFDDSLYDFGCLLVNQAII